MTITIKS